MNSSKPDVDMTMSDATAVVPDFVVHKRHGVKRIVRAGGYSLNGLRLGLASAQPSDYSESRQMNIRGSRIPLVDAEYVRSLFAMLSLA